MAEQDIAEIRIERLALPLHVPYRLVFGDVTTFDTLLVRMKDRSGREGFGEATVLTGYTEETVDGSWQMAGELARTLVGCPADEVKADLLLHRRDAPFTVTALVTAIEMMQDHPVLSPGPVDVPLLAILNSKSREDVADEVARLSQAGYSTLKVKAGWDVEDDLARIRHVQSCLPDDVRIRIDANQGFSISDGVAFASRLDPTGIELLEQPCHKDDWEAVKAVSAVSAVPFMLDESIYGVDEIERAADLGTVRYVKLKLMKAGSLDSLMAQLNLIRERKMTPVLGNGVSADPGCWMECCVAHGMIDNAGEMNGFLKPRASLFVEPMTVASGAARLPAERPNIVDTAPYVKDAAEFRDR